MSVGRDLCKRLIDVAEDMRDYAALVHQFKLTDDTKMIYVDMVDFARKIESVIPRVLAFEGETVPELTSGEATR